MTIHYQGHGVTLHHGDCLDVLRALPDASVDSVVTDPPYGLEFMGKEWDSFRPDVIVNRGGGVPGRAAWDSTKMAPVEYGGAKQRSTLVCDGCGKSDKFRNAHDCPDGTGWTRRNLDTSVARVAYAKAFQDWCEAWATECLRVLKPGGHLLAFGGTRTWHRLACAVEDAGFEIRDSIAWMHGQGFPKSLDVSKAIDKRRHDGADIRRVTAWVAATRTAAGVTNRDIDAAFGFNGMAGHWTTQGPQAAIPTLDHTPALLAVLGISVEDVPDEIRALLIDLNGMPGQPGPAWFAREITQAEARPLVSGETISFDQRSSKERERRDIPATPDAERWQGWGTALKPAFEPVVVARKPLSGTVAATVLAHGTGALNIDGCRINPGDAVPSGSGNRESFRVMEGRSDRQEFDGNPAHSLGRWPANVVLDESQAEALDEQSGEQRDGTAVKRNRSEDGRAPYDASSYMITDRSREDHGYGGQGGASRFFPTFRYEAKAPTSERPRYTRPKLRLRDDLTPAQVDHVRARLAEAGVQVD